MASNRSDSILLLVSSGFLALGLASWYERVNDKPFDLASIFGTTDAPVAIAENAGKPAETTPIEAPPIKTASVESAAVSTPSVEAPPVKTASVETAPVLAQVPESQPAEVAKAKLKPVEPSTQLATTTETSTGATGAQTVTIVLSPQATDLPKAGLNADTNGINDSSAGLDTDVVIALEALTKEVDDLDTGGVLVVSQEVDLNEITSSDSSDNLLSIDEPNQTSLSEIQFEDATTLLDSVEELGVSAENTKAPTYRVAAGDNLYRIALRHGTSVDILKQLNALESDRLQVGDELRLP